MVDRLGGRGHCFANESTLVLVHVCVCVQHFTAVCGGGHRWLHGVIDSLFGFPFQTRKPMLNQKPNGLWLKVAIVFIHMGTKPARAYNCCCIDRCCSVQVSHQNHSFSVVSALVFLLHPLVYVCMCVCVCVCVCAWWELVPTVVSLSRELIWSTCDLFIDHAVWIGTGVALHWASCLSGL